MTRRDLIVSSAAMAGVAALGARTSQAERTRCPNILFIISDQQHWMAQGWKDPFFHTPALDKLASQSVVFENAFCTTPQCSPSRSSLVTGRYPHKTGVIGNIGLAGHGEIAKLGLKTIGYWLQKAGYVTAWYGKWHLGDVPAAREGWDEFAGDLGGDNDVQALELSRAFLERRKESEKPFALFASFINPHDIYQFQQNQGDAQSQAVLPSSWKQEVFRNKPKIQKEFMTDDQGIVIWDRPEADWKHYHDLYAAKVKLFDDNLKSLLEAVDHAGLADDTAIIVASDHGDMDTHHRLIYKGPFMYEHVVHVPLQIKVPSGYGGLSPRKVEELVTLADVFPTLLDLAKAKGPESDGHSLAGYVSKSGRKPKRDFVISQYYGKQAWNNPIRMIRTKRYKYNLYLEWGEELYDLEKDPDELTNLAGNPQYDQIKQSLKNQLKEWIREKGDPFFSYGVTTRDGKLLSS